MSLCKQFTHETGKEISKKTEADSEALFLFFVY